MNMSNPQKNKIAHSCILIKVVFIFSTLISTAVANTQSFSNSLKAPSPIETITVCTSQTKKYSIESPELGYTYHWNVTGGTLSSSTGSEVSVIWDETEGEGTISVYAEQTATGCKSEITELKVQRRKSPSATFDNAQVCNGEPLKITFTGTAPYEIYYNINGDEKNITSSKSEYTMPNIPGKYTISKVKDKYCETNPDKDNTSEILPRLHKLTIKKE